MDNFETAGSELVAQIILAQQESLDTLHAHIEAKEQLENLYDNLTILLGTQALSPEDVHTYKAYAASADGRLMRQRMLSLLDRDRAINLRSQERIRKMSQLL